jgi:dethiobiotin synthetase
MKTLLVTGTDTDVGKTWISCALLKHLRRQVDSVGAYKPVCSGVLTNSQGRRVWSDVEQLAAAVGWTGSRNQICPQRFDAPVAPHVAAELENRSVDDALLDSGLQRWHALATHTIAEGAGGLLCPLSAQSTVADLAVRLKCPILIVAANRLGVINHTMLTVEVARQRGLHVAGVVLNDCQARDASSETNFKQLAYWLPKLSIWHCPHNSDELLDADGNTNFSVMSCFA